MPLLEWRESRSDDREALKAFECTQPPRKSAATRWHEEHPRPWELEVQAMVRDFQPPAKPPKFLLLGFDHEGLAAISRWEELDGPSYVELLEMAIARRCRGSASRGVSGEMFAQTLDYITERALAAGLESSYVQAYVWHENGPSQRMCREAGLAVVGSGAPGVQAWGGNLPIAEGPSS